MENIGFIGLGIMGKPMCKNLLKAGHKVLVYDCNEAAVRELRAAGANAAASSAEVGAHCNIIITMLPNSPQVRTVLLGKDGVSDAAKPGTLVVDMSSIDPTETRAIGKELADKGIRLLDAPVSGGEPKAIDGTLSVMAGGDENDFSSVYDLLMDMAGSVVRVGALGCGNVAKLANQIIVALNISAVAEALVFAQKAGASPEKVYDAIRGGLAGSTVLDAKAPMMLQHNFKPGFRVELHIKDLANALAAAQAAGVPVPLTGEAMTMLESLRANGYASEDHSALLRYYEEISGITLA